MNCPSCGVEVDSNSVYCPKCGARLGAGAAPAGDPQLSAAPGQAQMLARAAETRARAGSEVEDELWSGGYSAKDMAGMWLAIGAASIVIVGLAAWIGTVMADWSSGIVWSIAGGLLLLLWAYALICYLNRRIGIRYRLTSQRFFHERGVLRHVTDRIEVIDMDDITFEQSILQRMFNVGTIHITSSDSTHPVLDVRGIENVREVASLMDNARRSERMRRGLHIEAV